MSKNLDGRKKTNEMNKAYAASRSIFPASSSCSQILTIWNETFKISWKT